MKDYSLQECESLITNAAIKGCEITTIDEGVLGLGTVAINGGVEFYSYVIKEYPINEWTSGHKVTRYKKLPKKYNN